VHRHIGCVVGSLVIILLQIFSWFWKWQKFANWSIFDEVIRRTKMCPIFGPPCIYRHTLADLMSASVTCSFCCRCTRTHTLNIHYTYGHLYCLRVHSVWIISSSQRHYESAAHSFIVNHATVTCRQCDSDNTEYKYVCITTNQSDTKSSPNPNPNPTTKQHAVVSFN